jgi:hypothetical protein
MVPGEVCGACPGTRNEVEGKTITATRQGGKRHTNVASSLALIRCHFALLIGCGFGLLLVATTLYTLSIRSFKSRSTSNFFGTGVVSQHRGGG